MELLNFLIVHGFKSIDSRNLFLLGPHHDLNRLLHGADVLEVSRGEPAPVLFVNRAALVVHGLVLDWVNHDHGNAAATLVRDNACHVRARFISALWVLLARAVDDVPVTLLAELDDGLHLKWGLHVCRGLICLRMTLTGSNYNLAIFLFNLGTNRGLKRFYCDSRTVVIEPRSFPCICYFRHAGMERRIVVSRKHTNKLRIVVSSVQAHLHLHIVDVGRIQG